MNAETATIVSLGLVACYTPLSIVVHAGASRLPVASRRPVFLEVGMIVLAGVSAVVALLLGVSGQAGAFLRFLFRQWPQVYWYPAALLLGGLLYLGSSRLILPMLRRAFAWLGLAVAPRRSEWPATRVIRSYLSPGVLVTMPFVNLLEEALWRGFTVFALTNYGVSPVMACLIASVFYGTYHYTMGTHHAALNGAVGFAYGLLFIETGNLLVPLCAHLVYNALTIAPMKRTLRQVELLEKGRSVHGY